jgi:hypothetical protein
LLRYFAHFGRIKIIRLNVCKSRKELLLVRKKINENSAMCKSGNDMDSPHLKQCYYLRLSTKQLLAQYISVLKLYIAAIYLGACVCLHWTIIKGCSNNTHCAVLATLHAPYTDQHSAGCRCFLYDNCITDVEYLTF